jgi:Second Messenger Oligonucleotide or Dinucleotide Synthetase domain
MGLADWFSNFCQHIQIQDAGTISTRYKAITQRLNTDFWNTALRGHPKAAMRVT